MVQVVILKFKQQYSTKNKQFLDEVELDIMND